MKFRLTTAAILLTTLPGLVSAQYRRYDGPPRRGASIEEISRVITDCERRTDEFKRSFSRALDYSRYRDTMRGDELNREASKLERAMNKVREAWNRERNPEKTRAFVSSALNVSVDINRTMVRGRLHPEVQRQWDIVRSELNRLAEVFALPKIRW